jgi:hypothetical protein
MLTFVSFRIKPAGDTSTTINIRKRDTDQKLSTTHSTFVRAETAVDLSFYKEQATLDSAALSSLILVF